MRNNFIVVCAGTIALSLADSAPAATPAASDSGSALEVVTVTAARVRRDGYEAPTPTTVLDSDDLTLRPADTLSDLLTNLPQMRNATNGGTGGIDFGQSAGRGFVNLRGLGTNRTLVLLDGHRVVGNDLSGDRDVLSLPSALITRVDVVTGGASALYGSDAIAGVVNFIINSRFTGFKASVEGGTSAHADATERKVTMAWGGELSDRWHLVASAEFFDKDGITSKERSFATPPATVPNPDYTPTNGERPLLVVDNAYMANQSFGGLILNGPLAGQQFLPNGTTAAYVPASCYVSQPFAVCNSRQDLSTAKGTITLSAPQRRLAGFGRLSFQVTPGVETYLDAIVSRTQTTLTAGGFATNTFNLQIPIQVADNPFLPAAVRSQYLAAGVPVLQMGRENADEGPFDDHYREWVGNLKWGLNADMGGGWLLKAQATYGRADDGQRWTNVYSIDHFLKAVDAVLVNGTPTCRINTPTVTDPACVPANIFGSGNLSPGAKGYFLGNINSPLKTNLHEVALDLTGEPLSVWAGPVSAAAGASYRDERTRHINDGTDKDFAFSGYPSFSGDIAASEVYSQLVVPLARDQWFAKSLEVDLAARWVRYNHAGSEWPWKFGLNWMLIPDLRIRLSRSQDIRAPNVLELNLPQFPGSINPVINPEPNGVPVLNSLGIAPGQTIRVREIGGGNPALTPEIAHTTAAGIVLQPTRLQGLRASIDYYRIQIQDAITNLSSQTIVQECAAGNTQQCALIADAPGSALPTVATISVNAQSFVTSGLDSELRYSFGLAGGEATLRALANYILQYEQTVPGAPPQDLRGDISSGIPRLQGNLSALYKRGPTTALVSSTYIGGGNYSNPLVAEIQNSRVPHVWYVDATLDRQLRFLCADCSMYASVSNLFDQKPPHPGYGLYTNVTSSFFTGTPYDRVGRYFRIGFRIGLQR
jgi:iron complex outermembrane receptor protein